MTLTPTRPATGSTPAAVPAADHLSPAHLAAAQRHLVTKAISELAHERLLSPEPEPSLGPDGWRLPSPGGPSGATVVHVFTARRLALEHWAVDPASVQRLVDGRPAPLDAQALLAEHAEALGIPDRLLATYLEEVAATLAGAAWKRAHRTETVADLLHADHQAIEAAMTEGHPGFVANNGRIGFGVDDHAAYAPEAGAPVRLVWLAARRTLTRLSLGVGLTEQALVEAELDADVRAGFEARLLGLGLRPADYLLLPVHPWQWRTRITTTFAPDLARRDLVLLGEGPDEMQAQQSIRTFANRSHPGRSFVKTALAVQNMGFLRGLSPAYMGPTPAINDWVHDVVSGDETLTGCGFSVLRERAAIGYTGDVFHRLLRERGVRAPQQKMLAALWRESAVARLGEGERLSTMAALLHRDAAGRSLAVAMIAASGLPAAQWVRAYLRAYLRPLVHCLLAHDLAFMPHGENVLLVLRGHTVVRTVMKDIGEEVALIGDAPLPPEVERIRADVPPEMLSLPLHTDVLDGVLRHLAAILDVDGVLEEREFWAEVRACVDEHAADHPELARASATYALRRESFPHSCLNRLQLRNTLEMVDLSAGAEALVCAGTLANPIA